MHGNRWPGGDAAAQAAAVALGWPGIVLPETQVFGLRFIPIVDIDRAAHRTRRRTADGPQLDGDELAMWEWPAPYSIGPPPALRLSGALFTVRRGALVRTLRRAKQWRSFGPTALMTAPGVRVDEITALDCALRGIGLVPTASTTTSAIPRGEVLHAAPGRPAGARRRTTDRWVEEVLYGLAVDTGSLDGSL